MCFIHTLRGKDLNCFPLIFLPVFWPDSEGTHKQAHTHTVIEDFTGHTNKPTTNTQEPHSQDTYAGRQPEANNIPHLSDIRSSFGCSLLYLS